MVDLKNLKTAWIILSVLLIMGSPYLTWLLAGRLNLNFLIAFSASLLSLIAGLVLLVYTLKGEPIS
ncbi:hypothetical protein A3K70_00990 [Candidatus Bathyarchaeota archaeon RBG_16_48_13]|nr:MAG: hypothetical protein A3K70_00990 [Candidatus Bathyarchaeota archaeon RBG_16_48_13]